MSGESQSTDPAPARSEVVIVGMGDGILNNEALRGRDCVIADLNSECRELRAECDRLTKERDEARAMCAVKDDALIKLALLNSGVISGDITYRPTMQVAIAERARNPDCAAPLITERDDARAELATLCVNCGHAYGSHRQIGDNCPVIELGQITAWLETTWEAATELPTEMFAEEPDL